MKRKIIKFKDFSVNENLKSKKDFNKHIEFIFTEGPCKYYTEDRKEDTKQGMLKAYDFLIKFPKIEHIAYERLVEYMWNIYPSDKELSKREGMLKAYNYMSGKFDKEEIDREKVRKMISDKMKKMNL